MIPFASPYFRRRDGRSYRAGAAAYTPPQVATAYGIPADLDGTGQVVGIIELGGAFSQSDYAAYMRDLGISGYQTPTVLGTQQDDPGGANVEVMMDAEIIGAIAPQAKIRLYFAPNTDAGFAGAVNQAVGDGCDTISISWGAPESAWSASARSAMDAAMQRAMSQGINVFVAAGDNGSSDGARGNNVDYPASSPYAIGCGGTRLLLSGTTIISETVWNDGSGGGATGGGYSKVYAMPPYQQGIVNGSLRGVPDVSGVADPETGWIVRADGQTSGVGGTSAVAPMWAAITALMNQHAGKRIGWLNPLAYQNPQAFRDTITGKNGAFNAGPGWDACTGMGSPSGAALFALAGGLPPIPPPPPPPVPPPSPPPPPPVQPGPPELLAELDAHGNIIRSVPWNPLYALLFLHR